MSKFVYLIPLLPLLGFLFNFTVGVRLLTLRQAAHAGGLPGGHHGAATPPHPLISLVACGTIALSFLVSLYAVIQAHAAPDHTLVETLWVWIPGGSTELATGTARFSVDWAYQVDPLSSVMLLVVTFVGFFIHVYSIGYMGFDAGYARYMAYLNLFMFAMLTLVLGANYPMLFVGWEGVGLCSYLLIGFYTDRVFDAKSGMTCSDAGRKAFIVNRIGDFGFALGIFAVFMMTSSIDLDTVFVILEIWQLILVMVPPLLHLFLN